MSSTRRMKVANLAANCAYFTQETAIRPTKYSKKNTNSKADKSTLAIVRSIQKFGCVSLVAESLPEPKVGLAKVRRFILKSGKRSPRAQNKIHKNCRTVLKFREQLRPSLGGIQVVGHSNAPTFCRKRCKKISLAVGHQVVHNSRNIPGERRYILFIKKWKGE